MRISGAPGLCKYNYAAPARSVKIQLPLILGNSPTIRLIELDAATSLYSSIGKISLTYSLPRLMRQDAPPCRIRAINWDSSSKSWMRKGERPAETATKGSTGNRLVH